MSELVFHKGVTYSCGNGGTITINNEFRNIYHTGIDGSWAYFDYVYIDAYTDLLLDIDDGKSRASLVEEFGETTLNFKILSEVKQGRADIHFDNLETNTWYRLLFNKIPGRTESGITHGKSSHDGKLTFNDVRIPNE